MGIDLNELFTAVDIFGPQRRSLRNQIEALRKTHFKGWEHLNATPFNLPRLAELAILTPFTPSAAQDVDATAE